MRSSSAVLLVWWGQFGDDDARAPAADLLEVRLGLHDEARFADSIALGDGIGVVLALALPSRKR